MNKHITGIERAREMRHWSNRKGGRLTNTGAIADLATAPLTLLLEIWLARLRELAYAPRSVTAYNWSIRSFLHWAEYNKIYAPEQITRATLERYQRWLFHYRGQGNRALCVTTQRERLSTLKSFFTWCSKAHQLPINPAADLELPHKPHQPLPRALSVQEIHAVLAVPNTSDPLGLRDRAILETFYATGIRRSELVHLDVADLDLVREVLLIRKGKGGKDRMVPLGAQATHWLDRYLRETRPLLETEGHDAACFLTGYGARFSAGALGNWVRQVLVKAHISRAGNCHLFRHSCATHMLENGADIRYIQQLLGHARLDTTQIYAEVSILQLKAVHARTHPSARGNEDGSAQPPYPISSGSESHSTPRSAEHRRPTHNVVTEMALL